MCDAEDAHRAMISGPCRAQVLMCFFHVKQAVKTWVEAHAAFPSLEQRRLLWKREVEPAFDLLHISTTAKDFDARLATMETHCCDIGVVAATTWLDKQG